MSYLGNEQQRFISNYTPEIGFNDSSVPTPDSMLNGQISQIPNNPQLANFHTRGFYTSHEGGELSTHREMGMPTVYMETSFRVMSPQSEITAASLRTLQGIRVANESSYPNTDSGNSSYSQPKMNTCNVHVVSDKVSPSSFAYTSHQHDRSFKPVEQLTPGRSLISPTTGANRVNCTSNQHAIEQPQPISHRVFPHPAGSKSEFATTPPFPHNTFLSSNRSFSPASPPEQNYSQKKNLSQSSISLPVLKPMDQSNPASAQQPDAVSLGRESIRRSRAETEPEVDPVTEESQVKGQVEPQPIYTWGFQLWECFSDTKWCLITGFFPCITEFVLSRTFGVRRLGFSFVLSSVAIVALLVIQLCLVQQRQDSLGIGISDGFLCNILLYSLLVMRVIFAFKLRNKVRNEYQISGSAISDCCVICVCPYCALCQMKQHYDYYDGSDSEDEDGDPGMTSTTRSVIKNLSPFHSSKPKHATHNCVHHPNVKPFAHAEVRGSKQSPISQLGKFLEQNVAKAPPPVACLGGPTCQHMVYPCRHHTCCGGQVPLVSTNPYPSPHNYGGHACAVAGHSCRSNVWVANDGTNQQLLLQDGTRVNMHRY